MGKNVAEGWFLGGFHFGGVGGCAAFDGALIEKVFGRSNGSSGAENGLLFEAVGGDNTDAVRVIGFEDKLFNEAVGREFGGGVLYIDGCGAERAIAAAVLSVEDDGGFGGQSVGVGFDEPDEGGACLFLALVHEGDEVGLLVQQVVSVDDEPVGLH